MKRRLIITIIFGLVAITLFSLGIYYGYAKSLAFFGSALGSLILSFLFWVVPSPRQIETAIQSFWESFKMRPEERRQFTTFKELIVKQEANPSWFLYLAITNVEFNPEAYLKLEKDYLILNLLIHSALLTDLELHRLIVTLSIDGAKADDKEILPSEQDLVIKSIERDNNTGKATEWNNIKVKLTKELQKYLENSREQGQDVRVHVLLKGFKNNVKIIELNQTTNRLRVPKLPQ